jgi:hypothetical protein
MSAPSHPNRQISPDMRLGKGVRIFGFTDLYGCEINHETKVGAIIGIQKGAKIGRRRR